MDRLFTFLVVSFKALFFFLILIHSNLSIFSSVIYALDVISKKTQPKPESQRFTSTFSSTSFTVLALRF